MRELTLHWGGDARRSGSSDFTGVRVDHAPAPTLLCEEAGSYLADQVELIDAAVDLIRVHGPNGS
jgi:hypothetical protein